MDHFNYREGTLFAEDVSMLDIAKQFGTPCYVYSRSTLERHWKAFDDAFENKSHLICYSVKANDNLAILNVLARLNSGFDIVSVGELERVLVAGGDPERIIFSGVGKRVDEIERALEVGIHCFNVESLPELHRINVLAKEKGKIAPISIRVNPNIDPKTHPHIATGLKQNKFGVASEEVIDLYQQAKDLSHIDIKGIDCHIGSQLTSLSPFLDTLKKMLQLVDELAKHDIALQHIDLGGGLGAPYHHQKPPSPSDYAQAIFQHLKNYSQTIILEPGRAIAGNAGMLITKIEYLKQTPEKNFLIVDVAMNDLVRPALYNAWHTILPVSQHRNVSSNSYDVVGPVCESADCFGKDRELIVKENDLLALRTAGAYGAVMSSHYNARPRAAEVMVDGDQSYLIRSRESIQDMYEKEKMLP